MNELSVLKLFQLSNGDVLFNSMPTRSTICVDEVRAHYDINILLELDIIDESKDFQAF